MSAWGEPSTTDPQEGPKRRGSLTLSQAGPRRMRGRVLTAYHGAGCRASATIPAREGPEHHPPLTSSSQSWHT